MACTGALPLGYHTDCCLRLVQGSKLMVNYWYVKRKVLLLYSYTEEQNRGGTVVKVLCYKSEGRWFDPR